MRSITDGELGTIIHAVNSAAPNAYHVEVSGAIVRLWCAVYDTPICAINVEDETPCSAARLAQITRDQAAAYTPTRMNYYRSECGYGSREAQMN